MPPQIPISTRQDTAQRPTPDPTPGGARSNVAVGPDQVDTTTCNSACPPDARA